MIKGLVKKIHFIKTPKFVCAKNIPKYIQLKVPDVKKRNRQIHNHSCKF